MRLVFMGTSEFAVPSLVRLNSSYHDILAVITKPDRPKGRGKKLSQSPVKRAAVELGCNLLQPDNVNEKKIIASIESFAPDLFIVLSFGQILCKRLLEIPKKGAINVHPSLIPKYRGAAPIQWALINGDKETGVTTMLMDGGIDTGCILMVKTTGIDPYETSSCLSSRLSNIGSDLLLETIEKIKNNTLKPKPQSSKTATKAPQLKKKDGEINWNDEAFKIVSLIRGVHPWPGAFTHYKGNRLKIISASVVKNKFKEPPGTILKSCKRSLVISAKSDAVSIDIIQSTSGRVMPISAFLCGFHFEDGTVIGKIKNCCAN